MTESDSKAEHDTAIEPDTATPDTATSDTTGLIARIATAITDATIKTVITALLGGCDFVLLVRRPQAPELGYGFSSNLDDDSAGLALCEATEQFQRVLAERPIQ